MKIFYAAFLAGTCLVSSVLPARAQPIAPVLPVASDWQSVARSKLEPRLASIIADVKKGDKSTATIRNLPNGALASLFLGHDPAEAEFLLRALFANQDMNPSSPSYGSVPWQMNHPEITDLNSDEFSTQALGPLLIEYGDKFTPEFRKEIETRIRAFYVALQRRVFRTPAYTNIFVMRFVETILMGESLGDAEMASQGYRWMDDWLAFTAKGGVREYDSPTYTAVDLNSLYLGWRYAKRPGAHEKFQAALDLFWSDIAANYFAGRGGLSGPHSRDYSFVGGWSGGTGYYYDMAGLKDDGTSEMQDMERVYALFNARPENYQPSAAIVALAQKTERIVRSRWEVDPFRDRYNYLTPDFTIGGATGDYGPQDKLISVELASAKKLPVICITPDTADSPYGTFKTADRTGHQKATHLPLGPTCVQEKWTLLALLDIDVSKESKADRIATSILLPAKANQITLDGVPVTITVPFDMPSKIGCVVGVREGNAGVAIRLVTAGTDESSTTVSLKADAEGLKSGAARLVAYTPRTGAKGERLPVCVLIIAARCPDQAAFDALLKRAADAPLKQTHTDGVWTVEVTDSGHTLTAVRDLLHRKVVSRRIDGSDLPIFPVLEVDGHDLATPLIGSYKVSEAAVSNLSKP